MAREDWEHLFYGGPSHLFSHERGGVFDGLGLFDDGPEAPIKAVFDLLEISPQRFIDMLNEPRTSKAHLMTNREREFRAAPAGTEFFTMEMVFPDSDMTVHEEDLKIWLDDNFRLLKKWRAAEIDEGVVAECLSQQGLVECLEADGEAEDIEALRAENERLKARIAELENAHQKGTGSGQKTIDPRERKTFLKLIMAALFMEKQKSIEDRSLAGKLASKSQEFFPDSPVAENTVRNKMNEIKELLE